MGPMTGRGCGPCGLGFGRGRGFGMGRRFWGQPQTKKDHLSALADYEKTLKEELEEIKKAKEELSKEK
jgi:hypothetical protein